MNNLILYFYFCGIPIFITISIVILVAPTVPTWLKMKYKKTTYFQLQCEKKRPPCPFYGFARFHRIFIDSKGNQCPLVTESTSPCVMQMDGQSPCWDKCHFQKSVNPQVQAAIVHHFIIFPNEFHPPGQKSWNGMPFKIWLKHILGRDTL